MEKLEVHSFSIEFFFHFWGENLSTNHFGIGPLNSVTHGIRLASIIAFSVFMFSLAVYVLFGCVTFFLILLQYNIRPPDPNCDVCALEFAGNSYS